MLPWLEAMPLWCLCVKRKALNGHFWSSGREKEKGLNCLLQKSCDACGNPWNLRGSFQYLRKLGQAWNNPLNQAKKQIIFIESSRREAFIAFLQRAPKIGLHLCVCISGRSFKNWQSKLEIVFPLLLCSVYLFSCNWDWDPPWSWCTQ